MSDITYLDPARIVAKRRTPAPLNYSRTGYGSKLPSLWQLKLDDKRWYRVYVVQWSNAGSAYIKVRGKRLFLGSYDPGHDDDVPEMYGPHPVRRRRRW